MVLSNAEKQRAWRERHIWKRRTAHRIVNLLIRKQRTDKHVEQIADLLTELLNRHDVRVLRRRLKLHADPTDKDRKENAAYWHAQELLVRDAWLREHPGRTKAEYNRLLGDDVGEVWEWRWAKGRAINESRAAGLGARPSGRAISRARVRAGSAGAAATPRRTRFTILLPTGG